MQGNPHRGSKVWKTPDRKIGKAGENRGKIVARRDLQPTAAFHDRENRRNLRSRLWAAMCNQFFRPRAIGRMGFSARLVLSSNSGYSKKRVSFFQSLSAY